MLESETNTDGLRVAIGFPGAVMLVIGGIVGVGIFVNPAVVARSLHTPGLVLAAWALGGVIAMLGAFVYAELAARIPATGGEYVYLRDTYGRLVAFLFGWATLLVVQCGGQAAVAIVFAKNIDVVVGGGLSERAIVVAVLAGLAGVNCLGVKSGNGVQAGLGALKLAIIGVLIGVGLAVEPAGTADAVVAVPDGVKAFGAAMIPVVFSYGGWQTANYVAGEMKNPRRNLARALLVGVLAVIALYVLVNIACLHALGVGALGRTLTPASDVLLLAVGPVGARLAAAAIAVSALAFLSQGMLTGPRVIFAMARDGVFFPSHGARGRGEPCAGGRHCFAGGMDAGAGAERQLRADFELRDCDEFPVFRHQRFVPVCVAPAGAEGRRAGGYLSRAVASLEHWVVYSGVRGDRSVFVLGVSG